MLSVAILGKRAKAVSDAEGKNRGLSNRIVAPRKVELAINSLGSMSFHLHPSWINNLQVGFVACSWVQTAQSALKWQRN